MRNTTQVIECEDNFNVDIHLGYNDYAQDEQLVQALGNAIYQGFEIKVEGEKIIEYGKDSEI